jgi:hypothetical protein
LLLKVNCRRALLTDGRPALSPRHRPHCACFVVLPADGLSSHACRTVWALLQQRHGVLQQPCVERRLWRSWRCFRRLQSRPRLNLHRGKPIHGGGLSFPVGRCESVLHGKRQACTHSLFPPLLLPRPPNVACHTLACGLRSFCTSPLALVSCAAGGSEERCQRRSAALADSRSACFLCSRACHCRACVRSPRDFSFRTWASCLPCKMHRDRHARTRVLACEYVPVRVDFLLCVSEQQVPAGQSFYERKIFMSKGHKVVVLVYFF